MCGICGFNWQDKSVAEKMTDAIKHRGPDDAGLYADVGVSLGHRRLSIIDTSARGHQPMEFDNLVIVYNGEIYNFKELREQLKSKGYSFRSDSDTEVILYSYHLWGESCVNKFNGMWAFCIYDKKKNIFFLSRDRFGIKPLYYYFEGDKFIFSSELKAVRQHDLDLNISTPALNFFFYQKYIGQNLTIFENCYKLKPSENLTFDLNQKKISITRYYNLEDEISRCQTKPLKERLRLIENRIKEAVEKRLVADVPIGSFLSGGVDSSIISAIISRKHKNFDTFSIGFKDKSYDELQYSKEVSKHIGTDHHYDYMEIDEKTLKFILENMDEPFGDSSVLPTYLLSKITRRKVTVSLSGDAGDEVFGGYDTYMAHKLGRYIPRSIVKLASYLIGLLPASDKKVPLSFKMKRFIRDFSDLPERRHLNWMGTFTDSSRKELLRDIFINSESLINCGNKKNLLSVQLNDIHNYLAEDILKKVDTASMLNSLEIRVPFLDHQLVPVVLSLPEKYKIRKLTTKWLLKKISSAYIPKKIVHRPKRGFTVPVSRWVKNSDFLKDFITNRQYYSHGLLNYDYVLRLFNDHINNREDNARQLWLVFIFNCWWNFNFGSVI